MTTEEKWEYPIIYYHSNRLFNENTNKHRNYAKFQHENSTDDLSEIE